MNMSMLANSVVDRDYALGATPSADFSPEEIIYRFLTIKRPILTSETDPLPLKFRAHGPNNPIVGANITECINNIRNGTIGPDHAQFLPTPYDIKVTKQCYIVLVLDPDINWRFRKDKYGVTTKDDNGGDNFQLRHIPIIGPIPNDSTPSQDDCRLIYFGLVQRGMDEAQGFNFHIEFFETDTRKAMRMIFDPDIKDGGGSGIPPHQLSGVKTAPRARSDEAVVIDIRVKGIDISITAPTGD